MRLPSLLMATVACCVGQPTSGQQPNSHTEASRPAVVSITVNCTGPDGKRKPPSHGSGFIVYTDEHLKRTYILTATHVVLRDDECLYDEQIKGFVDKKITVKVHTPNNLMVLLSDDAHVVAKFDQGPDVAVVSVPAVSSTALRVGPSVQLNASDPVVLLGFPISENGQFVPRPMHVRFVEVGKGLIKLEPRAEEGQSGGPIIDAHGRVVAISSENESQRATAVHLAIPASIALEKLNAHLKDLGRPPVLLRDETSRFSIRAVRANLTASVAGNGGGDLKAEGTKKTLFQEPGSVTAKADGGESNSCPNSRWRVRSLASATASLARYEGNGMQLNIDLAASGGRYLAATTCLAERPVGLRSRETRSAASVSGFAELEVNAATAPFDLRVVWKDMPEKSRIAIVPPGSEVTEYVNAEGDAERVVSVTRAGLWRFRAEVDTTVAASGTEGKNAARHTLLYLVPRQ